MARRTARAYIDGHNFYHGCVKQDPALKWLDLHRFCDALLGRRRSVELVRYYTARVIDFPNDPHQSQRQDVYLRALAARPRTEVIEGHFAKRTRKVMLTTGTTARAVVYEEKGSDVNLAADLVFDATSGDLEVALVISNDFDLQRAINHALAAGVEVLVANPHRDGKRSPSVRGSGTRNIRRWHLEANQLPEIVLGGEGEQLARPTEWR